MVSLKAVKINSSNQAKTSHLLVFRNKLKAIRVMPVEVPRFLRDTIQAKPCHLYGCLLNSVLRNFHVLCKVLQYTYQSIEFRIPVK